MFTIEAHAGRAKAFRSNEDGAAAVEFALIAPILIFTLLSLIEIGVMGMITSGLDGAVIEAARRIRTGRDDAATSADSFEDQICANLGGVFSSCRERLVISVQRFSAFGNANLAATAQPDGQFDKGAASDIILVKANYTWPLISPFVATAYGRSGPMEVTITSRVAFKNEPFQ
jgi:Flp pilus assembly protein TadG